MTILAMSDGDEAVGKEGAGNVLPLWVVVDGITKYCTHNGIAMSKPLAEHLVNSVVANSVEETKAATLTKENLESLTDACIKKFQNEPFAIAAAELQIYLDVNFPTRECFLNELRHQQDKDCYVLLDDILNTTVASKWELEQLTKKIVTYVIVRSFLGDLKDIAVFKDCAAALSSIWPEGTVNRFSQLTREKKKTELQDYLFLSSGVRLFNREKQQGGVGITDVRQSAKADIQKLRQNLLKEVLTVTDDRKILTEMVDSAVTDMDSEHKDRGETFKDALILLHQYLTNLDLIKNELAETEVVIGRNQTEFAKKVKELQDNCRNERVIAANVVFPLFVGLAKDWFVLQDEARRVTNLQTMFADTRSFLKEWNKMKDEMGPSAFGVRKQSNPRSIRPIKRENIKNSDIRVLHQDSTARFDQIAVAFKGCCVTTLVQYPGFLAAGNKSLGLLCYDGKYMCFRDAEAAERFGQRPGQYMDDMSACIRKRSVLEKLLGLVVAQTPEDNVEHLQRRIPYCEDSSKSVVKIDVAIQPELHPVASHWDPNYEWNVWNIRKQAYKNYLITKSSTHSTQTVSSQYRAQCGTQTTMPLKDQEVQTKQESGTAAVKPLQFLAGLRGGPHAFNKIRFKQIDLSLDKYEESSDFGVVNLDS